MDISKLEKQADILFNNISGWNTNALKRIGRRVKSMKSLSYADLQAINNATIVNQDVNAIMEELARLTQQNVQDVYRIYGEMISEQHLDNQKLYDYRNKPFVPFSKNKELQALVKAYARTTAETFVGLTMTKAKNIGFVDANNNFVPINKQFKTVLDKATVSIATGTGDFGSEMRDVLKELGGSGLRVDYGGGVTRRLDTMVRQNLLWGAKQASVEYNNMIGEELGCDGIEIDWHSNPRPSHEFMQGKQYILGKAKTINGIYFESADRALEALQDYGCLHFSTPIICGVSEPAYSPDELKRLNAENKKPIEIDGVTKTGYEWKQTMRRLETEARKTKDQKEILKSNGDNIGANQLDYKLKAIKSKYNLIAKETGIKAQPEKMAVIKSAKTVDKYSKSGIIKEQGSKNIVAITDNAIDNVPKVSITGFSDEQNAFVQQQHKELLKYAKDNNDNKEVAFVFRSNLSDRTEYIGTGDSLDFGNALFGKGDNLFVMHNHPSNSSYSNTDIAFFLQNDAVKTFTIVKNDGSVEILSKLNDYDKLKAKNEFKRQYKKYVKQGTDQEISEAVKQFLMKGKGGFEWIRK